MDENVGMLYAFATDLVDTGVERVARHARELGLRGLTVTLAYHQARDLLPRTGAGPRLRYREDGVFFTPDPGRWADAPLTPPRQPDEQVEAVAALRDSADRLGVEVEAWTVFLHNSGAGARHPELASRTCFGDTLVSNLCPSHPDVAAYALALADDVAAQGFDVVAEALSAQTFAHGHHHERSFTPLGESELDLLGLCFCEHCSGAATAAGADVSGLRSAVRSVLQDAFAGAAPLPIGRAALGARLGPDLDLLIDARTSAVTELVARCAEAVRGHGRRFGFMDLTGAVLGYDDGRPSGPPAAEQAWRIGIDPARIAPLCDSYSVLGYVDDPGRLESDVRSYAHRVGGTPLRVILRPGAPDTRDSAHLRRTADAALAGGADRLDFYNYGMYSDEVLARIGEL